MMPHLDRHARNMVSERKKNPLAPHTLESCCEFDLADRKSVTEMEGAVHVCVWKCAEPFGMAGLHLFH